MTTRTQTLFLAWIGFCIITHIDIQTLHLTQGIEMVKFAKEQFDLSVKFTLVSLILAVVSYIFDFLNNKLGTKN